MSSSTPSIRAVLFDLDGLLIDSEPIWQESEIQVFGELGLLLDRKKCMQTMGLRLDEVVRYWRKQEPSWDCAEDDDTVVAMVMKEVKGRILESAEAMPGAISLVNRLSGEVPLGLASSSYMEIIECALQRLGLTNAFQVVHSAQHEKRGKPAPDVYLSAARSLSIEPDHCLVIEDSPGGARAGLAAGMQVIAVPHPDLSSDLVFRQCRMSLRSLEEFPLDLVLAKPR